MLSFEIGQRESGFYRERTESQIESPNLPVPYYYIDIYIRIGDFFNRHDYMKH